MSRRRRKQPQHQPSPAPSQSARGPDVAPARPQGAVPSAAPTHELGQLRLQSPAPSSSKAMILPHRPDSGRMGRKVQVRANHFLVNVADMDLHHYDVSITPEIKSKKISRDVMSQLVQMYGVSHMNKRIPAFDGRKNLYTAGPLPFESKQFVVRLGAKDEHGSSSGSTRNKREREYKVTISYASKTDLHHLREFLRSQQLDTPQKTIQVLDVVLRASPSENYTVVGRSLFSPSLGRTGALGGGIEYWRGYYQSLRPTQMGLSLNIDISARPFYENIFVTEFIAKHFNFNLSRRLFDQDRIKLERALRRVQVELTNGDVTRSYIITGLSKDPLSELKFTLDDKNTKTTTTVVRYFREKYNVKLNYLSLPALQAGNDAKLIYLPMELCKIAAGQRYSKKLNGTQVNALLGATCQRPLDREKIIRGIARSNNSNRDKLVQEFGIEVGEDLALCDARVLPPPRLKYHDTAGKEASVEPLRGQWNMINKKMFDAGDVQYWTCLNFSTIMSEGSVPQFCEQLRIMCTNKGLVFNPTPLLPIRSAHPSEIEEVLRGVSEQAGKGKLQLLIIILPNSKGSYAKIKRICETELGIVSQCCQPKKALTQQKQYLENLALKINVKVGGRNTVLMDKIPHVTDRRPTIIFGADVTHPESLEDSSPSIAAVVASMDWPGVSKYCGIVSAQPPREEIILDLYKTYQDRDKKVVHGGMIRDLLLAFYRSTKYKPLGIIFYRDGVGEGQFRQVLLQEIQAIRKACVSLEETYLPEVTFLVVQKRHHTRFFPVNNDQRNSSGNILPGTVVDTHICHPREFDFYINSHASDKGTSRPTHYHVLLDENNFKADELQTLTNNLCYTYARCTKSVSIVPPVYYAHLAAFRARCYIEGKTLDADSGSGSRRTNVAVELPEIVGNVKNVMFYC